MVASRIAKALRRSAVVNWREQPNQYDIAALQANIARVGLVVRVRWSLVIALAVYSVFGAWAYAVETPVAELIENMTIPAIALGFVCVYNAYFQLTYRRLGNLRFFNHAQLLLDTVVVTILVYYSGGVYSWFAAMYLLFILEAAFILPVRRDVWFIALAGAVCYGGVVWTEYLRIVPHIAVPFVGNELHVVRTYVLVRYMWILTVMSGTAAVSTLMMRAVRSREDELARCAVLDPLTGLYNRQHCQRTLEDEIDRANADGGSLAVVVVDVDGFVAFNRLFGVETGDRMLGLLAGALRRAVEEAAPSARPTVCRFGGEEFVVILPGGEGAAVPWKVAEVAEAARASAELARLDDASVTLSVGYAVFPADAASAGDLLVAADQALAAAQAAGGNQAQRPAGSASDVS